jgi:hypothetical protein
MLLCQKEYLQDHTFIPVNGIHPERLDEFVHGKSIQTWINEEPSINVFGPTNQAKTHRKFFFVVPKDRYDDAMRFIDIELPKMYREVPRAAQIAGYEYPCRPDHPKPPSQDSICCGTMKSNRYNLTRRTQAEIDLLQQPPPRQLATMPFESAT